MYYFNLGYFCTRSLSKTGYGRGTRIIQERYRRRRHLPCGGHQQENYETQVNRQAYSRYIIYTNLLDRPIEK